MTSTAPPQTLPSPGVRRFLPSGWRWGRLGDVCRVVGGSTPASGVADYWNGDLVWITPADLGKLTGHYITISQRCITTAGYESCGTDMVPPGSVVLSSRAPIGHLGIAAVPLCTNQGCKSLVPGADVDSLFLYYSLRESVHTLRELGSGATFSEVSKSQIEEFRVALPSVAEQKRIAAALTQWMAVVERARAAAEAQLEAAATVSAAYLRKVFDSTEAQSWERRRIRDIAECCSGATPARHRLEYFGGTIPWVKTGELRDDLIERTEEHVTEAALRETSLRLLPAGTLLVAMYGQGQTRGRTGCLRSRRQQTKRALRSCLILLSLTQPICSSGFDIAISVFEALPKGEAGINRT
jgi:type I restriction enzyme S subunit